MISVVGDLAPQFGLLNTLPRSLAANRGLLIRPLFLLLLLGLSGVKAAVGADAQNPPVTSLEPGLPFAIADFDGDLRPDLASIRAGANNSGKANYSIQLQLTSAGRQSIELIAPAGGLLIEARDVNGDHAVDLVLATAWFRKPVAIFLNDGHGRFLRSDPTTFPRAWSECKTSWRLTPKHLAVDIGLPPQSRDGACQEISVLLRGRSPTSWISFSSAAIVVNPFLVSHAGRAPPSEVS